MTLTNLLLGFTDRFLLNIWLIHLFLCPQAPILLACYHQLSPALLQVSPHPRSEIMLHTVK